MTPKEAFSALGYKRYYTIYHKDTENNAIDHKRLVFHKKKINGGVLGFSWVTLFNFDLDEKQFFADDGDGCQSRITPEEMTCIYQQMKELGWLNETEIVIGKEVKK